MRLSQIARKLGATQSELSEKLVSNGEKAPEGGNSKLTDDQIALLFRLYNYSEPEEKEEEVVTEPDAETTVAETSEPEPQIVEEVVQEEVQTEVEEVEQPEAAKGSIEEEPAEEVEVIRAKKIKLEGIKVLGKIDLPEKPVKVEEESEDNEDGTKTGNKRERRQPRNMRSNDKNRRRKPELTFEEKQALEERNRLKEKRKREKQLKEKKKKYFEQNIKPKQEQVGNKQKKKKKKEFSNTATEKRTKITTKNPFKRFWIWLNDPYA
ncbi:hypothetical protein [Fulvivirga sp.]|uniref:hypothetical protein n=1 Tax=Fulvivirga sp. TaxID=1931237 RepID=UPI0032EEA683